MTLWVPLLFWLAGLGGASEQDRAQRYELGVTDLRDIYAETIKIGKGYYLLGYRKEAIYFLYRALELDPGNQGVLNDIALLEDFDNPFWKRKKWKSPKDDIAKAFEKDAKSFERALLKRYVEVAEKYRTGTGAILAKPEVARGMLLTVLGRVGGPFEVDGEGALQLGAAGSLPADVSSWLLEEELATVDGQIWFKDSVLRSLPDVAAVKEARGKHFYVRVLGEKERAEELLEMMEQAYGQYAKHTKQEPIQPMGLFVFPDKDSFQKYCDTVDLSGLKTALGFAKRNEGLAISFEQAGLEQVCVHEGAHLFFRMAFAARMPSWYDEGFASFFGQDGTMTLERGKLKTGLPMLQGRLSSALRAWIPQDEFLSADAAGYAHDASRGQTFYAQSWAYFTFLTTTRDRRFKKPFEEWESFCLGSSAGESYTKRSIALFDRLFEEVRGELDEAVREWVADQVK
ncbi:MAG: hypothetical protein RL885_26195 [Planctomycetota bacterium]